ncbi:hypothetical protein LCGC14_2744430 [marine sediment metagenome]|uniref:Uncharacterized protein n=1 Tax=marine sediment metagenome TaxID=412755 RepID=A0A0F9BV80_9ZZZZ
MKRNLTILLLLSLFLLGARFSSDVFNVLVVSGQVTIETGPLYMKERATPTAKTNYGAIYTKTDNTLYFQDGAATEHKIMSVGVDLGEMYINNNAVATTIETAAVPIALRLFTTGDVDDWTFDAGSTGAITAFANAGGGSVRVTSAGHSLATGEFVTIRGTTNYNGIFEITSFDASNFDIVDTWAADDGASDWDQASSLIAGSSATGTYIITWAMSATAATINDTFLFSFVKNDAIQIESQIERKFANNDVGAMAGTMFLTIAAGDSVWMTAQNDGTGAITVSYANINLHSL